MSNNIQKPFFFSLLGAVIFLTALVFWPYLNSLLLAVFFAVALFPVYSWSLKFCRGKSKLAATLAVFMILIVVLLPLIFLGFLMFQEAQNVYIWLISQGGEVSFMTKSLAFIQEKVHLISPNINLNWDLGAYAESGLNWLFSNFGNFFSSAMSLAVNLFLIIIALFYLFTNGKQIMENLKKISPLDDSLDDKIFTRVTKAVDSVVRGYFFVALMQGTLTSLGLYFFGVPNPLLWGAVAAIASFVPFLGTAVVLIPAVIFLFATGNTGMAIGLTAWGFVVVNLVDNYIMPMIIKRGVAINPFLILLSVMGGLSFFGPMGLFIGPLTLSLLLVLLEFYPLIIKKN
ncbi:MAG: AI-2E family transporter [bacterium]